MVNYNSAAMRTEYYIPFTHACCKLISASTYKNNNLFFKTMSISTSLQLLLGSRFKLIYFTWQGKQVLACKWCEDGMSSCKLIS